MEPDISLVNPVFAALIARLATLSKQHLLYFRLEVGRAMSEALFQGDAKRYHDQANNKEGSFREFVDKYADELEDLGLTDNVLRQCLLAWYVVEDLPAELVQKLLFSHVVALTRVTDRNTRHLLAQATVEKDWRCRELRNAVLAAAAGKWIDAEPKVAGLQPPAPEPEPEPAPALGRVVTRFEKNAEDFDALVGQWEKIQVEKLTRLQQQRMDDALARVAAKVEAMRAKLKR